MTSTHASVRCSILVFTDIPKSALCTPTCTVRVHGFELRLGMRKSARSACSACRRSARRGQILFRRGYSCRWGIMADKAVFEEHFLHYDDFPRRCKWLTSVDRYSSTMERKLVVGIRDFCILSSRKACLEGNEKEKLTREVLSVLVVAQKSTRRRVEWIKWGLFTVGFFVWSTPHCHSVSSKVTGKLVVSLQPFQWSFCKIPP